MLRTFPKEMLKKIPADILDEFYARKGVEAEPASLKKAQEEDMPVLATGKTAYEVSVLMGQAGVLPPAE